MVMKGVNNPFLIEKIIKFISLLFERLYQHYLLFEKYYNDSNDINNEDILQVQNGHINSINNSNNNTMNRDSIFDSMFDDSFSELNSTNKEKEFNSTLSDETKSTNINSNKRKTFEKARKRLFVELVSAKSHLSNLQSELLVNIENRLYTGKGVLLSLIENILIINRLYHLFIPSHTINKERVNCFCNTKKKRNLSLPSDKELSLNFELPKKCPKILKCGLDILKQFLGGKLIGSMSKVLIVDSNIRFATLKILGSKNFALSEIVEMFIYFKKEDLGKLVAILDNLKEFVLGLLDSSDISVKERALKSMTKFNFFTSNCFTGNKEVCIQDKLHTINELENKLEGFVNKDLFELLVDNSKKLFVQKLINVIVKYRIRLFTYNKDLKTFFYRIDSLFSVLPNELKSEREYMAAIDNLCVKKLYETVLRNKVSTEELLNVLVKCNTVEVIHLLLNLILGVMGHNTNLEQENMNENKIEKVGELLESVFERVMVYDNLDSKQGASNVLNEYWANIIETYYSISRLTKYNRVNNKLAKCGVVGIKRNCEVRKDKHKQGNNILDDVFRDLNI
eukprot:GAHX01000313.1.p1 GENE.GAHX01000313.1~~GAHX01000313.1.p1  ORF type:complete len:566 (-),score=138.25 GAHX01000313.1:24-1721(-)